MGRLVRQKDWTLSGIGEPGTWSSTVKSMVATILSSPFPMHLTLGEDFIQIYNDRFLRLPYLKEQEY